MLRWLLPALLEASVHRAGTPRGEGLDSFRGVEAFPAGGPSAGGGSGLPSGRAGGVEENGPRKAIEHGPRPFFVQFVEYSARAVRTQSAYSPRTVRAQSALISHS